MSVETFGGIWRTENYKVINDGSSRGCEIDLFFKPNEFVEAKKIGLTQSVRPLKNGKINAVRTEVETRATSASEGGEGTYHDRAAGKTNPIYGTENPTGADKSLGSGASLGNMDWGSREVDAKTKKATVKEAHLYDGPQRSWATGDVLEQSFETTALAIEGPQKDTYFGSVEWGYKTDDKGTPSLMPLKVVSMGVPTSTFMKSAEKWNNAKVDVSGTQTDTQDLPLSSHQSLTKDQVVNLSDEDLKKRIETLAAEIKKIEEKTPASPDAQNKKFELKVMEGEAKARGTFWGGVKHFFGFLAY